MSKSPNRRKVSLTREGRELAGAALLALARYRESGLVSPGGDAYQLIVQRMEQDCPETGLPAPVRTAFH